MLTRITRRPSRRVVEGAADDRDGLIAVREPVVVPEGGVEEAGPLGEGAEVSVIEEHHGGEGHDTIQGTRYNDFSATAKLLTLMQNNDAIPTI